MGHGRRAVHQRVRVAPRRGPRPSHDLRHSAATILLAAGVPERVVIEILGHSTLAMVDH